MSAAVDVSEDTVDTPAVRALVAAGDRGAWAAMWECYAARICLSLRRRGADRALAEDLAAETFCRARERIHNWREAGRPFGAWLFRIAANLLVDHHKRGDVRRTKAVDLTELPPEWVALPDASVDALEQVTRIEQATALGTAIRGLTGLQQQVVRLRFYEQLTPAQVGAVLGMDRTVVKSATHRAVRSLARDPQVQQLWQQWRADR